jgi:hypothetical protein
MEVEMARLIDLKLNGCAGPNQKSTAHSIPVQIIPFILMDNRGL